MKKKTVKKEPVKGEIRFNKKKKKQVMWFFVVIILVFASFLGTWYLVNSAKKFEYAGLEWDKMDYNGLKLFHSKFPIVVRGELKNYYNLYLRNDPRYNNVTAHPIFGLNPNVMVSITPEAGSCYESSMGNYVLGQFLGAVGFNVTGAIADKNISNETGIPFADCSTAGNGTSVIIIKKSLATSIDKDYINDDCYLIHVGDCENIRSVEKFIVAIIAQVNNRNI